MASNNGIDFAKAFGYSSTAAAIVFAVLYFPLLAYFIFQSFARPTYVHIVMVVFCSSESRMLFYIIPRYNHRIYSPRMLSSHCCVCAARRAGVNRIGRAKTGTANRRSNPLRHWIFRFTLLGLHTCPRHVRIFSCAPGLF